MLSSPSKNLISLENIVNNADLFNYSFNYRSLCTHQYLFLLKIYFFIICDICIIHKCNVIKIFKYFFTLLYTLNVNRNYSVINDFIIIIVII